MSQVITPRFPLQGPPNYYLIKRWFQAVTHKAGSIITMELEKCLLPDVVLLWQGDKMLWKDPSLLLLENIICQAAHLPGTVSSGVSDGSLHWSAVNQVSLFLWLTLISFCWQQAVARGPAAFWRLPTHARGTGNRKSWLSSHHEPGSVLSALETYLLKFSHRWYFTSLPVLQVRKLRLTGVMPIAQDYTANIIGRAGIWTYICLAPEPKALTPMPYC